MARICITGSAGRIGRSLQPRLRAEGHDLTLVDVVPQESEAGDRVLQASVTDVDAMTEAFEDADLVVHLAGFPQEREWSDIRDVNIEGGRVVCEAARRAGVRRLLLASSVHAVGVVPVDAAGDRYVAPRPDTYYGVSKVVLEALGSLYADRFGMTVISARIMTFDERPSTLRSLATWLSPDDMARLVLAALGAEEPGHSVVWGVSNNAGRTVSLEAGRAIGYEPRDDAALHEAGIRDRTPAPVVLGGEFVDARHPLGENWS